jgi:hypothetical protein
MRVRRDIQRDMGLRGVCRQNQLRPDHPYNSVLSERLACERLILLAIQHVQNVRTLNPRRLANSSARAPMAKCP